MYCRAIKFTRYTLSLNFCMSTKEFEINRTIGRLKVKTGAFNSPFHLAYSVHIFCQPNLAHVLKFAKIKILFSDDLKGQRQ